MTDRRFRCPDWNGLISPAFSYGETLVFQDSSTADSATIANNFSLLFAGSSTAESATITNNFILRFSDTSTGGTARLINGAFGNIDLSLLTSAGMTAGSIEGSGNLFLGAKNLAVGGNNLSTTFSGVIQDGGSAELVRLNVDVIVTRGTPSALAARNATRTIPIVMASVGDVIGLRSASPVQAGTSPG
jgi:hypothetical protein